MLRPKFNVGKVTISTEALCALVASGQDADFFLQKHASGDWGDCDPATQEQGLREGSIVVSRFRTLRRKIIVVTTLLAKGETSLNCELIVDAVSVNHGFTYDTGPVAGFKYDGNFGPVSMSGGTGYPLFDVQCLVAPTHDAGPAAPKEGDSVNPGFKYDATHPDCDPFPSPIHKASPYYTGPTEPKKADPAKPKEEQP
jgi:hypothetical protein